MREEIEEILLVISGSNRFSHEGDRKRFDFL